MPVCLSNRLYQINANTELIGPKFCMRPYMIPGKIRIQNICFEKLYFFKSTKKNRENDTIKIKNPRFVQSAL